MSAWGILDVVIGLAFVYLLLSLICSVINEWIAALANRRPKNLEKGLWDLLGPAVARQVLKHELLRITHFRNKRPAYIPSWTFAKAALDLVRQAGGAAMPAAGAPMTLRHVQGAIANLPSPAREALAPLAATAKDIDDLQASVERWFNEGMDRVSGLYKRWNMLILVGLSLLVSVVLNADTFAIGRLLWTNPALRAAVVDATKEHIKKPGTQPTTMRVEEARKELAELNLGLGWGDEKTGGWPRAKDDALAWWAWKVLGLLFTTAAVSLGAPFWFDTLNKIMQFRSAVKPGEQKKEEKK